ncbi:MAG: hypothetical protein NZM37_12470 [Sandaracinaceae bacterium]|nr:hypothetical protein [Sandaracinaceae bacterium]
MERGESQCSNRFDDDGDGLVDCDELACRLFPWCPSPDAGTQVVDASLSDSSEHDGQSRCQPASLVIVLDVSSSMQSTLEWLRRNASPLFEVTMRTNTTIGMVVFVDDAILVNNCAPFAVHTTLAAEFARWHHLSQANRSPLSGIENVDCTENALDAVALAATSCPWNNEERLILLITDDTFAERPAVLSGPFGRGIPVNTTYAEVAQALLSRGIRLFALSAQGLGQRCPGPRWNPEVGQGWHVPFGTQPPLPHQTGGMAWDLNAAESGVFDFFQALESALALNRCRT